MPARFLREGIKMTVFLTSHIGGSVRAAGKRVPAPLLTQNSLIENLKARWPERAHILFLAADPDDVKKSASYEAAYRYAFPLHGLPIASYTVCDSRNLTAANDLGQYDVIILSGGHVPTQNAFFQRLGLRERMQGFSGILIGISAGTMNCAEVVYAHPELEGEAVDPNYQRFLPGLGLTKRMILPHYQSIKEDVLDGLRIFEDIAYPDSVGREFIALNDGSYILSENGGETLYGEACRIQDGRIHKICCSGESCIL